MTVMADAARANIRDAAALAGARAQYRHAGERLDNLAAEEEKDGSLITARLYRYKAAMVRSWARGELGMAR